MSAEFIEMYTIKGQFTAVFGTMCQIMNASGVHLNVYKGQ